MAVETVFRLDLDENTRALTAGYTPGQDGLAPPSWDDLIAVAQAQGWNAEVLDQTSAVNFIEACRESREPVLASVGEVLDGSFALELAQDRMSVLLSVTPPRGGRRVTLSDVQAELAELGVVYGVRDASITQSLADRRANSTLIAQGTPPTAGTPTRFDSLLDELKTRQEYDDKAVVDYRSLGNLMLVAPGTALMRRIPSVQGKPGLNVLGEAVPPVHIPDTPFASGLTGVVIDESDPCLLRAANAGSPMLVPRGVLVNSLVEVDQVNLSTGNIDFDGTLKVRGDITAGMEVRVSGDVVVHGTIEAARVQAGGSIIVDGGVIGLAENRRGGHATASRTAQLIAGESVWARFIENAIVKAEKTISIEHEIRQSLVYAGQSVRVGKPKSTQGLITGGEVHARTSVNAGTIGSLAAVPTLVCVGVHPHAKARQAALRQRRASLREESDKLEKLIAFLHQNPAKDMNGLSARATATYQRVQGDMAQLEANEQRLQELLRPLRSATISATQRYYGGVTLRVSGKQLSVLEEQTGGCAMLNAEASLVEIR
ncbi:FapA family protein [Bordetella avium]|uniref:FapA family protein n=1 Tax=Bordetella avium TaxID=521 RepID=UPI000E67A61A|nr:FapA family protein [Bordetella avium]AZY53754.1 DUF342 domain-containing protein [Bordetella avium]RIQ19722.1 DUF342 domain-containing protein [Bordetella avium]RIQ34302.1 DUF342 domain-containing protein [Bordetella avium]